MMLAYWGDWEWMTKLTYDKKSLLVLVLVQGVLCWNALVVTLILGVVTLTKNGVFQWPGLNDNEYKLWLKTGLCLTHTKEGIGKFADDRSRKIHNFIKTGSRKTCKCEKPWRCYQSHGGDLWQCQTYKEREYMVTRLLQWLWNIYQGNSKISRATIPDWAIKLAQFRSSALAKGTLGDCKSLIWM